MEDRPSGDVLSLFSEPVGHPAAVDDQPLDSLRRRPGGVLVVCSILALVATSWMLRSMVDGWVPWARIAFIPSGLLAIVLLGSGVVALRPRWPQPLRLLVVAGLGLVWLAVGASLVALSPQWHRASAAVYPEPSHGRYEALVSTYPDGLDSGILVRFRQHTSLFPDTWTGACFLDPDAASATFVWSSDREFDIQADGSAYTVEVDPTSGEPTPSNLIAC